MREDKRRRLEDRGWRVGGAKDFLALSDQEAQYIEMKLKLAEGLREKRRQRRFTQGDVAKLLHSSQSRVAKMESADPSVSIDLIIRSLLALGSSHPELGKIITRSHSTFPPPAS
jgi:predicted XRE-type DNA-binding protein